VGAIPVPPLKIKVSKFVFYPAVLSVFESVLVDLA
jgi:hypothetical protein